MVIRSFFAIAVCAAVVARTQSTVQPDPNLLLSIGVESGDSVAEFSRASSALRLSNGDIVVANSSSSQVRWFSAAGKYVRTVGRRGRGPGEFWRSVYVSHGGGDTVIVLDAGNGKIHYLDPGGNFVRSDSISSMQRTSWMYDRTIVVRLPINANVDRMRTVAAGIPFRPGELARRAVPDRTGNLWVRNQIGGGEWTGYGAAGRAVGTITLPPSFEPYQIADTLVLGRDRDSLGVERIQLRRFLRTAGQTNTVASPRPLYDATAEGTANERLVALMTSNIRNLITAQEAHFAENGKYSATLEAVPFRTAPELVVKLVQFTGNGFWIVASHPSLRTTCIFAVGEDWPMGAVQQCG